jgi:hypothetical protein
MEKVMSEQNGAANTNADAGAQNAPKTDERSGWTAEQWQDFAQREADRRVTEAQKKWREDLTAQLTAKEQDAETRIGAVLEKAKQAETRAAFAERANEAGIADIRAAWAVVKEYGLADNTGAVDFKKLKDAHPALFAGAKQSVAGRPSDTGAKTGKPDMNALIRGSLTGVQ